jgi:SNF2 family DNA or RNA helicase
VVAGRKSHKKNTSQPTFHFFQNFKKGKILRLISNCPACQGPPVIQSKIKIGKLIGYVYKCGHLDLQDPNQVCFSKDDLVTKISHELNIALGIGTTKPEKPHKPLLPIPIFEEKKEEIPVADPISDPHEFASLDKTCHAYKFQEEGIKFAEKTNLDCLIADPMGLGKTIQALLTLKRNSPRMFPCLIIVPGTLIFQWTREFKKWVKNDIFGVMPILGREQIISGFENYIISRDLISRKGVEDRLVSLKLKSIIVDESHSFKDPSSNRTIALIKLIQRLQIRYRLFLSGTPIKNRADEYFTILNLLAPQHFKSFATFRNNWLTADDRGQYKRISPWRMNDFKKLISNWVIRREKSDVLTNLPPFVPDYQFVEITDALSKKRYNEMLFDFQNWLSDPETDKSSIQLLGWLVKFRVITGQAKCAAAIEWAKTFLDESDESLAIGINHKTVRDTLYYQFQSEGYSPLKFSGEDSVYQKERVVDDFNNKRSRLLIINQIAGGIGLNLQKACSTFLNLERMWSSSDEDQFTGRFHRDGQKSTVFGTFLMAANTIDQGFHEMIEEKRQICGETLDGWDIANDYAALQSLADRIVSLGYLR